MMFVSFLLSTRQVGIGSLHEHLQIPYMLQHVACVREIVCSQIINTVIREKPSFLSQKGRVRAAKLAFVYFT